MAEEEQQVQSQDETVEEVETAESNDSDIHDALLRETDDGKGGAVVPSDDFDSFATDGVEEEED